jgi:prepilin-type processing-associated H-X9-DG protein
MLTQPSHGRWVALTSYVGIYGLDVDQPNGVLVYGRSVTAHEISDGLSQTLLAGERPPSADMWYGWWYSSWGQRGRGNCDMLLGVREINVGGAFTENCPRGPDHFRPGRIDEQCDLFHYWSLHPGGANFAFCDGSVRFLSYSADPVMPALATRAGGEAVRAPE